MGKLFNYHSLTPFQVGEVELKPGHMRFWHGVAMTDKHFGPVHLGIARPIGSEEYWYVISDEAMELKMFEEYGLRFDIELTLRTLLLPFGLF